MWQRIRQEEGEGEEEEEEEDPDDYQGNEELDEDVDNHNRFNSYKRPPKVAALPHNVVSSFLYFLGSLGSGPNLV